MGGPSTDTHAGSRNATTEPIGTIHGLGEDRLAPQAMLMFAMGGHCVSDSCELGVLNEYPEALKKITSNACLGTSSFLTPALQAAMAELRLSMMVQSAVRLTAISLRLIAELLPGQRVSPSSGFSEDEQHRPSESIRGELDQALPYYEWQGPRNYYGRIQYVAALLEEAIRVLAVPKEAFTNASKLDVAAFQAIERIAQSVNDLEQPLGDVCGAWAVETLLSASALARAAAKSPVDEGMVLQAEISEDAASEELSAMQSQLSVARIEKMDDEPYICKTPRCLTPNSSKGEDHAASSDCESEDLPSPSRFVPRRRDLRTFEGEIAKAADDTATPGSRASK
ncbi:hypothetical protein LTR85_000738 [Meristemomyces frigidus]|nr:hypothetical protein LTR85_000738 [Meristemomyces frigidus]